MAPGLFLVDVFAARPCAGNPLAVVMGAESLADELMQRLAAEINFSETAFVDSLPDAEGNWHLRLFTPTREIAFAGHPILGAAWVIRDQLMGGSGSSLRLRIGAGDLPVSFDAQGDGESIWFGAPFITLGPTCPPAPVAAALGLAVEDLAPHGPIQQASAGTAALIVPLRDRAALRRSRPDPAGVAALKALGFPPLFYLFCRDTEDPANQISARFFFEAHGMREDPATGNGAAFLGAWLLAHGAAAGGLWRIEQGHGMGRPSLVMLEARPGGIRVGGRVVPVARGELCLSGNCL